MKFITQFSRIVVGALFIFSGLIKLNDPVGFSFKLEEYFSAEVLNLTFLEPLALQLAVFVVIFEVILGIALLVGFKPKVTVWLLFLMIVFFTFLTFYSAYFNKVTDCGCFGDAIPLTPWQSFYKDLLLLGFILMLMVGMKHIKPLFSQKMQLGVLGLSLVGCIWIGYQVMNHLPLRDFRPYAIGKSISEGMKSAEELGLQPPEYQVIYTLKNESTGESKKVTNDVYISERWWENKEWKIQSEFTETKLKVKGYEPPIHDFTISTDNGEFTESILEEDAQLMVIAYDLPATSVEGFKKMANLGWDADKAGIPIICMTSISGQEVEDFKHEVQAPFEFAVTDKTTLKTIIRSNPGLVYIKKGVIMGKWHYNDVPTIEEIKEL